MNVGLALLVNPSVGVSRAKRRIRNVVSWHRGPPGSVGPDGPMVVQPSERTRRSSSQAMSLAVRQAKTGLGGLGALAHWHEPAGGQLRLVASDGLAPASTEAWSLLIDEQDAAPARAVQLGAYVWVGGDALGIGASGTAAVPILGPDGPIGALSVLGAGPDEPDTVQRSFLRAVAVWTASHIDDVPLSSAHEPVVPTDRSILIGRLTAALAEAVDSQDVVQVVADHVMPPFGADGLQVVVLDDCGRLHTLGSAGYPKEFLALMEGAPHSEFPVVHDAVQTRAPQFVESKAELHRLYPPMRRVVEATPKNAWAFLPMIASGRTLGVCVVSFSEARSFSGEERILLTALSGLVGQAMGRARLFDAERARARELQRALLPRTLPQLPAACAATRYLPAGQSGEVGGDWYDVIPLAADRVAVVIGDVMGHGLAEAVTMGRLRTAVRTLADLDIPPDDLFGRLNDLVSELGEDFYATCLCAVFDPVTHTCSYVLAGHPQLTVVRPDGTVHSPVFTADPPLGAAQPPFETHELQLSDESLLVLCTDGLLESRSQDVEEGLARLRRILSQSPLTTTCFRALDEEDDVRRLEELCDTVVSALLPNRSQTDDDACLLIVHTRCTASQDVASCELPDDPQAAGLARQYVRVQLAAWELPNLVTSTELLVSELVGNVIRHARGPIRLRLLRSRTLICEVYDGSLNTPRIRHASYADEDGRGLQLVAALSRRWGARYLSHGKCIWTEQELPGGLSQHRKSNEEVSS